MESGVLDHPVLAVNWRCVFNKISLIQDLRIQAVISVQTKGLVL